MAKEKTAINTQVNKELKAKKRKDRKEKTTNVFDVSVTELVQMCLCWMLSFLGPVQKIHT